MLNPGDSFGDYKVIRLLGQGGMGSVFLLENAEGVQVAAKILDPATAGDHEARKRFLREAELALGVKHPNLVETYDVGEDPETGLCYILMEYVPGGSLADRIKQGPLPINDAIRITYQIASVLELAREKGIVHRDIKPGNIMFGSDGKAKLADLGIARGGIGGTETTTVTQTGMMIGTPAYMAPEQMLDAHHVDTRADIYSLGIVFYEMLTGKRPNHDDTVVQLMAKAVAGEPIPDVRTMRPEVSAAVAELVSLMCAMKADERVQTPAEVTTAISQIVHGREVTIRRKAPKSIAKKNGLSGRRILVIAVAAVAVAGIVAFAYFGRPTKPAPSAPPPTPAPLPTSAPPPTPIPPPTSAQASSAPAERPPAPPEKSVSPSVADDGNRQALEAARRKLKPISIEIAPGRRIEFLPCPAGTFTMGFNGREGLHGLHKVTISQPFWIAKYPTTFADWKSLTGEDRLQDVRHHVSAASWRLVEAYGGEALPIGRIGVGDANALMTALNQRFASALPAGYVFRLPTMAEWEHAFKCGDARLDDAEFVWSLPRRWTDDAVSVGEKLEVLRKAGMNVRTGEADKVFIDDRLDKDFGYLFHYLPLRIGSRPPNAWGVCDMPNVGALTLDRWCTEKPLEEKRREDAEWMPAFRRKVKMLDGARDPLHWDVRTPHAFVWCRAAHPSNRRVDETWVVRMGRYDWSARSGIRPIIGFDILKERGIVPDEVKAPGTSGGRPRSGLTDRRIRYAKVDDRNWFYSLEDGEAVLWRGNNGYNNETKPCVEPAPEGEIAIPSELDGHKVAVIGNLAFFRCRGITSVAIPEGVREIRGWAFLDCDKLAKVGIPATMESMKSGAFCSCRALRSIDVGKCPDILGSTFWNCSSLEEVRVSPDNPSYVSGGGMLLARKSSTLVFYPRTRATVDWPRNLREIGEGAFLNSKVRELDIPDSVEKIGKNAFFLCNSLERIGLGSGLREVGNSAFRFCGRLRELDFPKSLVRLEGSVADGCSALKRIVFRGDAPTVEEERGSVLGKLPDSLEILVVPGTKGWNGPDSSDLPEKWPAGNFDDSRPIRRLGTQPADPVRVDVQPFVVEAPAAFAKEKAKLEEMLGKIMPALNGLMGGTLKTAGKRIVVSDKCRGYSVSRDGNTLTLSPDMSGFPKQTMGVGERVAVFLSGLGRKESAHTESCASAMDWYLSFRLRELLGSRFDGSETFKGDLSGLGRNALKKDPDMTLYDLRGESQNRKARKLVGSEKSTFAKEKCFWLFEQMRVRNGDAIAGFLKAWEREQAAGNLADPVSQDDVAALFSVAVGEDLFDWFASHGMPSSSDRTRVRAKFTGASTPEGWLDDLEIAKARAKASGKMILAAFEGSDWCGWCKKMEKDVYTKPDFMPRVTPRFVPVYIDKPRKLDLLSEKCRERNPELHGEYGIRGVPCVVILDAEGKEIGRVGGYKQDVDALMERVDALVGRAQDPSANVCTDEKRTRKTGRKTSTPTGMTDDFEAACEQAKKEKKRILLVFSGSDWCGFCKRLDDDVLSEKKFIRQVSRKYVPVYVDSPRDRSLLSAKAQDQNPGLIDRYSPNGYPTVVVTDSDGEELARFSGYGGGGSSAFMRRLEDSVRDAERDRRKK